ncbi:MAG: hypothetical protein CVU05_11035 [Bacteroidetes bacterium HGW-Bacteroidetes-21]|jgi:hypothetical protein|nr:MAG: hypothetical protein CVU05_11035 [Bacteroidetes bacterium HGW-Bacteroidetes-21]
MKKRSFVILLFLSLVYTGIFACEISFEVEKGKKEKYIQGDELVVLVKVSFTHRVCNLAIQNTKFDTKGLEILGGTDWKEESQFVWTRKLKLKVTGTSDGKLNLTATRSCDRVGGFASIAFVSKPVKGKKKVAEGK